MVKLVPDVVPSTAPKLLMTYRSTATLSVAGSHATTIESAVALVVTLPGLLGRSSSTSVVAREIRVGAVLVEQAHRQCIARQCRAEEWCLAGKVDPGDIIE